MADVLDIHKLKLVELKQECSTRGLEIKGNKQDLINRLQAFLEEHAVEEANEEDVLGEETEEEEQKPIEPPVEEEIALPMTSPEIEAEKKVVKIATGLPQTERLQKRAERFNVPSSLESKKAARAARFGTVTTTTKDISSDLKPVSEDDEKLKKRKERFGILTSSAGVTEDSEAKKRKRAERFGIV
ncbi:SAP domain-containing ribonucleoprotein isoform X2 [Microcaecilia unicolor]|uniref:SAP domain-containing ribonucleoprotein n=1 Tax=Microcaecilia unicolor TaxID=1415580 RepID=A0A6P7XHA5_9AMPH|nr:SAP domain-containing ribonucleoprotein isoform X2 [Microcaecilia unicolor]